MVYRIPHIRVCGFSILTSADADANLINVHIYKYIYVYININIFYFHTYHILYICHLFSLKFCGVGGQFFYLRMLH